MRILSPAQQRNTHWGTVVLATALVMLLSFSCSDDSDPGDEPDASGDDASVALDAAPPDGGDEQIVEDHLIGLAAAFPIDIDLVTNDDQQLLIYYNGDREMTVVRRPMGTTDWTYRRLGTSLLPWDQHNYPRVAVDDNGQIHASGNMHSSPLLYYRTTSAGDVYSFGGSLAMLGAQEDLVTYPQFFQDSLGRLLFKYRYGYSGDGVNYINVYEPDLETWTRLVDEPIIADATASAYDTLPVSNGGWFHTAWVWRETPATSTNHDVCYARSQDLINWEASDGSLLTIPIDQNTAEIIDPVPTDAGLLNTVLEVGFDTQGRVIVSYTRYDLDGNSQVYNARREGSDWVIYQTTEWSDRIEIGFDPDPAAYLFLSAVQVEPDGGLSQEYLHWVEGRGKWRLDEATLRPVGTYPHPKLLIPEHFYDVRSPGSGLRAAMKFGRGSHPDAPWYFLRWEVVTTIEPQPAQWPAPTELRIYRLKQP